MLFYEVGDEMSYLSYLVIDLNRPFLNEWLELILSSGLGSVGFRL